MAVEIANVTFTATTPRDVARGLLGWVSFTLSGRLRVDGVTIRRTRDGRLTLSFPGKPGLTGTRFFYLRPLNDAARREIESSIFQALGLKEYGVP